jgi:5,10-methylene-tetrahydrofolate dehydrogenase/methenyl tetrahydrofolate cyclohydrolase
MPMLGGHKAVIGIFCLLPFWHGFATLHQNSTAQKIPTVATIGAIKSYPPIKLRKFMKLLNNKVAIVTGSSRGIGAQIAITLADAGASVVINDSSNQKPADKVVSDIKANGGNAIAIKADISNPGEVKLMFDSVINQFGKIDILVNNAGSILYKTIQDTTDDDFDQIFLLM